MTIITKDDELQVSDLLKDSGLFDVQFYLNSNSDVAEAGVNPLLHYVQHGSTEGRDPNPLFDTLYYVERNPDVDFSNVNPLAHYILHGAAEGRDPHPLFDTSHYLKHLSELYVTDPIPLRHYLKQDSNCKISPHPLFDARFYLKHDETIGLSNLSPLVHYILIGASSGLAPHPEFDGSFYLQQNPDVAFDCINPLKHYITRGKAEERLPYNEFLDNVDNALSNFYPTLCNIEPLLPAPDELKTLQLRKSLRTSAAGAVYFRLAQALKKPFAHLVLLGDTNREHSKCSDLVESIVYKHGIDSLIVIAPDSCANTSGSEQISCTMGSIRIFGADFFHQDFTLTQRLAIILRVILQATPRYVYNCDSQVAAAIHKEYEKQLPTNTSWADCTSRAAQPVAAIFDSCQAVDEQTENFCAPSPTISDGEPTSKTTTSEGNSVDITFVMNCHAEGALLERTISAASLLIKHAHEATLSTEWLFAMDRVDDVTRRAVRECAPKDARLINLDFGDPGLARNAAVQAANGKYVAFMDADDLFSPNWLVEAHKKSETLANESFVLHPFGSIFFGETRMINTYFDSDASDFSHTALMEDSIWLTNGFAPRALYLNHPYGSHSYADGFDFEDWHWNCETIAAGVTHKMVPNTFFCYRVKPAKFSKNARAHSCLLAKSSLFDVGILKVCQSPA